MLEDMNWLERKVFRCYWDDGLLDLFGATGVFVIGLCWLRDLPVGAAIVPALLVPFWAPVRQRYIEPRLGMVEFTAERERRNRRLLRLVMYLGIGALILGIELYFFRDSLRAAPSLSLIAALPAFLLAILAAITSVLISSGRFLGYAGILIVVGIAGAVSDWTPGLILATAGVPMLAISIGLLARFVRANPLESEQN
jgi:hypothetical protein